MRLADFETKHGQTMSTIAILAGIAIALFLVAIAAVIFATYEWLAMRKALGLPPSNKLELQFRKAVQAFEHTQT